MSLPFLSSVVATFVRVIGATVVGEHSAVLLGGEGVVGDVDDPLGDGSSDKFTNAESLGSLGLVVMPRPPEEIGGKMLAAEGVGMRLGGSTVPIALRDLRLNRRFSAPKPGSVALVGYGGGFLAFDDTADKLTRATLYVPYAFSGGVPTKAMSISIDPEAESMMLIHGDGYAVVLDKDNGITLRADETTWMNMKPGETTIVSSKIVLQGNVAMGASPTTALPLLAGPASPPSGSIFVSSPL